MTLRFLTSGESHGSALLVILEGLPAGLPLPADVINQDLNRRQQGYGAGARMKIETDQARMIGGVMEGLTTGAPLGMLIENKDHKKWRGQSIAPFTTPRPGHADLSGVIKYAYPDLRPALERASARETAARVAAGAACRHLLVQFGIRIGGYVQAIGEVGANIIGMSLEERFEAALASRVGCPDAQTSHQMELRIRQAMQDRDTVGGVIEVAALGLPPGLGSHVHWDRKLEGQIGAAILSIPSVKGMEIGPAFEISRLPGSQAQDAITLEGEHLVRPTNHCGGIEGGITTGQPLLVRAALKPIATTLSPQRSVDLATGQPAETHYERSDYCHVPRAVVILETMLAYVLAQALVEKLGGDTLDEMKERFQALRQNTLSHLKLDGSSHTWWPE